MYGNQGLQLCAEMQIDTNYALQNYQSFQVQHCLNLVIYLLYISRMKG